VAMSGRRLVRRSGRVGWDKKNEMLDVDSKLRDIIYLGQHPLFGIQDRILRCKFPSSQGTRVRTLEGLPVDHIVPPKFV